MIDIKGVERAGVLFGVDLCVEGKGIFGVLGANGAQKSALARIITGCEDADAGIVTVGERQMSRKNKAAKRKIRLVPSCLELHGTVTPVEYLDLVGECMGVEPDKRYRQIKEALELVGIEDVQRRGFASLGSSARCRLSLAAALLGNPEYIVLDDPFSLLDGSEQARIYELLDMLGKIKTLVLFSHRTSEVKRLCKDVAILHGGKIALKGNIAEIEQRINATAQTYVTVRGEGDRIVEAIRAIDGVVDARITSQEANGAVCVSV